MLFDLKQKKKKSFFEKIGNVMAAVFKCALKLLTLTFISAESQDKTASVSTSYVTEIT